MKRFLFVVSFILVMVVACDVKSDHEPPPTLRLVDRTTDYYPSLYKFHDDNGNVTCYVSSTGNGGGVSCLRDEK